MAFIQFSRNMLAGRKFERNVLFFNCSIDRFVIQKSTDAHAKIYQNNTAVLTLLFNSQFRIIFVYIRVCMYNRGNFTQLTYLQACCYVGGKKNKKNSTSMKYVKMKQVDWKKENFSSLFGSELSLEQNSWIGEGRNRTWQTVGWMRTDMRLEPLPGAAVKIEDCSRGIFNTCDAFKSFRAEEEEKKNNRNNYILKLSDYHRPCSHSLIHDYRRQCCFSLRLL